MGHWPLTLPFLANATTPASSIAVLAEVAVLAGGGREGIPNLLRHFVIAIVNVILGHCSVMC